MKFNFTTILLLLFLALLLYLLPDTEKPAPVVAPVIQEEQNLGAVAQPDTAPVEEIMIN